MATIDISRIGGEEQRIEIVLRFGVGKTITAPDIGCVEFATRALNAFIKGRGNGEFPNPSGAISNSFFGAECTEKPNGNYSIKCWREPTNIAEAA
ncbi:TPA: hypothetical protein U5E37_003860 [Yersinia enterocolitica]|nr:hypothetical protein [Yersinia enterocolitica]